LPAKTAYLTHHVTEIASKPAPTQAFTHELRGLLQNLSKVFIKTTAI